MVASQSVKSLISNLSISLRSSRVRDSFAIGGLVFLVLLFVWPALLPGRVLMPLDIVTQGWSPWQEPNKPVEIHNFMLTDVVNYIYPVKEFMAERIRAGEFPLWNPYIFAGYPFIYNTQAGMFYPFSLLYYLLPGIKAVDLTIILQMSLGAGFMYAYLRQIALKRLAAMVGAVIFTFNGVMVVWLEWQAVHAGIIWLPAQLYLVERMARKLAGEPGFKAVAREVVGLALLFAIPWLGGHWSWTLYTSMTLAVYMALRLDIAGRLLAMVRQRRASAGTGVASAIAVTVASLGGGVALSLVQVLPAFHYLSQTHRGRLPFAELLRDGLFSRAIVLLVPNFFGSSVGDNWWGPSYSNDIETAFYCGLLTLLLASLALFVRRDWFSIFFAGWGALTLLWALGTPVYGLLYLLPVFSGLQPSRAVFLVTICLAVLAAMSVDRLMEPQPGRSRNLMRVVVVGTAVLLLVALVYFATYRVDVVRTWDYLQPHAILAALFLVGSIGLLLARLSGRLRPRPFGALALLWLVADLFAFGHDYNTIGSLEDFYPEVPITDFLRADPELFRIVTPARGIVFHPNTSLLVRTANISGYEPGILRRTVNFMATAEGESSVRFGRVLMPWYSLESPLLEMLNVKYILTDHDRWAETSELNVAQEQITTWTPLPAEQLFEMSDAGLQRLDLPLRLAGSPQGVVTIRVLSVNGAYEFAHAEVDAAELQSEAWHSFFFSPFPSEWGRAFVFRVEFSGAGGEVLLGGSLHEAAFAAYRLSRPGLVYEDGKTRVYLNEGYFPRAFAVGEATVVADEAAALAAVGDHAGDLDRRVFLELEGRQPPPDLGSPAAAGSAVTVTSYRLNRVELRADMAAPGFVVLSDTYYPGWQAAVDGEPTPVYRANSLVRAVYVPAGEHTITFVFRPLDFIAGAVISGLALVACVIILVRTRQRRKT